MAINTGVVGLDSVSFERSAEVLVMLVLGGAGNLWGALAGAVIFQIFEHIVSAANPFHWMTLVGLLLIIIVIFAPRGLGHSIASLWVSFSQRRAAPMSPLLETAKRLEVVRRSACQPRHFLQSRQWRSRRADRPERGGKDHIGQRDFR